VLGGEERLGWFGGHCFGIDVEEERGERDDGGWVVGEVGEGVFVVC